MKSDLDQDISLSKPLMLSEILKKKSLQYHIQN